MGRHTILLAAVAALISTPLFAAPVIEGAYIVEISLTCQYEINAPVTGDPPRVTSVFGQFKGMFEKTILKATFNPSTQHMSARGFRVAGDGIAFTNQPFRPVLEKPVTLTNVPYSNTSATLTIGTGTFKVFFGRIAEGKVKHAVFQRRDGRCAESGTAILIEN